MEGPSSLTQILSFSCMCGVCNSPFVDPVGLCSTVLNVQGTRIVLNLSAGMPLMYMKL